MEQDYLFLADLLSKFQSSGGFGKALIAVVLISPFATFAACFFGLMSFFRFMRTSKMESLPRIELLRRFDEASKAERLEPNRDNEIETQEKRRQALPEASTPAERRFAD